MSKWVSTFIAVSVLLPAMVDPTCAESLGLIRAKVRDVNQSHKVFMQLYANGTPLGPPFAHANFGFGWTPVSSIHLSATSSRSPIRASYESGFAAIKCEFDFESFLSLDGGASEIPLGVYHAPSDINAGSIPLGLKCDGESGELCSADPKLNETIQRMAKHRKIQAYNEFKRSYDQRINRAKLELDDRARTAEQALAEKAKEDFARQKSEAAAYLAEQITAWQKEFDAALAARRAEITEDGPTERSGADAAKEIVSVIDQEAKSVAANAAAEQSAVALAKSIGLTGLSTQGVKFSSEERDLLKQLKVRQKGAFLASTSLALSPVLEAVLPVAHGLDRGDKADLLFGLLSSNWKGVFDARVDLRTINNCMQVNEIDNWLDIDGNTFSSPVSQHFFDELRAKWNRSCQ